MIGVGLSEKAIANLIVLLQIGMFSKLVELDLRDCMLHDHAVCTLSDALVPMGPITIKLLGNPIVKPDTWFTVAKMLTKCWIPEFVLIFSNSSRCRFEVVC